MLPRTKLLRFTSVTLLVFALACQGPPVRLDYLHSGRVGAWLNEWNSKGALDRYEQSTFVSESVEALDALRGQCDGAALTADWLSGVEPARLALLILERAEIIDALKAKKPPQGLASTSEYLRAHAAELARRMQRNADELRRQGDFVAATQRLESAAGLVRGAALSELQQVLQDVREQGTTYHRSAKQQARDAGDYDAALRHWQAIRAIDASLASDSEHGELTRLANNKRGLALLALAGDALRTGDWPAALAYATEAKALIPKPEDADAAIASAKHGLATFELQNAKSAFGNGEYKIATLRSRASRGFEDSEEARALEKEAYALAVRQIVVFPIENDFESLDDRWLESLLDAPLHQQLADTRDEWHGLVPDRGVKQMLEQIGWNSRLADAETRLAQIHSTFKAHYSVGVRVEASWLRPCESSVRADSAYVESERQITETKEVQPEMVAYDTGCVALIDRYTGYPVAWWERRFRDYEVTVYDYEPVEFEVVTDRVRAQVEVFVFLYEYDSRRVSTVATRTVSASGERSRSYLRSDVSADKLRECPSGERYGIRENRRPSLAWSGPTIHERERLPAPESMVANELREKVCAAARELMQAMNDRYTSQ